MIALNNEQHGFAIAKAARSLFNPLYDVVVSRVDRDNKLLGGAIYYDFTQKSISMHIAGFAPGWISKSLLWVTFHYSFRQLGCSSVFCQIRSSNQKVIDLAKKVGFNQEVVISDVFPDGDLIIFRMRAESCRWLDVVPYGITGTGNSRYHMVEAA